MIGQTNNHYFKALYNFNIPKRPNSPRVSFLQDEKVVAGNANNNAF
ncbi:uncharacterized protein G2W53_043599 [Senna tora]|uniref:Uncharacterized protein n=1 Tax=Senna tora TaxID=362788 RepID=A0A834SHZ4_9FABA|nr:uncharacterized protein G2W53_043599 [Senna tora]